MSNSKGKNIFSLEIALDRAICISILRVLESTTCAFE
jgi:hypothetical protein